LKAVIDKSQLLGFQKCKRLAIKISNSEMGFNVKGENSLSAFLTFLKAVIDKSQLLGFQKCKRLAIKISNSEMASMLKEKIRYRRCSHF